MKKFLKEIYAIKVPKILWRHQSLQVASLVKFSFPLFLPSREISWGW
jgi:hypothetical protein